MPNVAAEGFVGAGDSYRRLSEVEKIAQPDRTRDLGPDITKALAIIAVVLIHARADSSWPLRFCVPVFIGIWSYYFELSLIRADASKHAAIIGKRFSMLFAAYAFWTVLYVTLFNGFSGGPTTPLKSVVNSWLGGYGWPGQYFFIVLFQFMLLSSWLRRVERLGAAAYGVSIAVMLAAPYLIHNFRVFEILERRPFFFWLPYYFVGVRLAHTRPSKSLVQLALVGLATSVMLCAWQNEVLDGYGVDGVELYFSPCVALMSICILVLTFWEGGATHLGRFDQRSWMKPISSAISLIGGATLAIFTAHLLFLRLIDWNALLGAAELPHTLLVIVKASVALVGAILVGKVVRRLGLGVVVGMK